VRIHDRKVFVVLVPRAGHTAEQRAAAAGQVIEHVLEDGDEVEVRFAEEGDVAVVYAGTTPVIQLGAEDAAAAGDASLAIHAASVTAKTREALRAERQRSAVARTVFSFSLVVFAGLVAFLLLRKVGELAEKARAWMIAHPERFPALRVRGIEVVQPAAVRGSASITLSAARIFAQIGVIYAWIIITLSLFEATHDYTQRLTGFVLTPLSALMARVAVALPLVVIAVITALVVGVALRFVRLFFGSLARGETTLGLLPRDLAVATGLLVRFGMVVVTLVVAAPLITGTDDGAISRAGVIALVALALASTPLLCNAAAGITVMYGRRLRVNEHAAIGGRHGRVRAITLLEVVLEDEDGSAIYVPHLHGLWYPTSSLGASPPIVVEVLIAPDADLAVAAEALERAAKMVGTRNRVDLAGIDADAARFRVLIHASVVGAESRLWLAISSALREKSIALGRRGAAPSGAPR
jgi:small-conductance mechanosensitive channel